MDARGYASLAHERGWTIEDMAKMLSSQDQTIANLRAALAASRSHDKKLAAELKTMRRVRLQEVGGQIGGTVQNERTVQDGG